MTLNQTSLKSCRLPTIYLYLTAAVSGAVVMIVEVLGASMLAPYMGTSHFVWSAQIAVTLSALATGYWLGGYAADRFKSLGLLYFLLLFGALFLFVPALLRAPIASWALRFNLAPASILTSGALFFIPLTVFAAVTPYLIRFLASSLKTIGSSVGRLSAVSTAGSLAGTLVAGYVMIPLLTHEVSLYLTAGIILLLVFGYFLAAGRPGRALVIVSLSILFLMSVNTLASGINKPRHFTHVREIFSRNTNYGQLQVLESKSGTWRVLLNDYLVQNQVEMTGKKLSMSVPTYMLYALAKRYHHRVEEVLCIGLGAGIVPVMFHNDGARVDVIEINPMMKTIAQDYFNFNPEGIGFTVNDARYELNKSHNTYDTIILDAFLGDAAPSHLMTKEAFASVRARLKPGGVLVINTIGDFKSRDHCFTGSIMKTLVHVFAHVNVHAIENQEGGVYFVASDHPLRSTAYVPDWSLVHVSCRSMVKALFDALADLDLGDAMVLTDTYNPLPVIDAARREVLRRHFFRQVMQL